MSDCSAGGVTVHCDGGCGAISAGHTVWVWCEPVVIDAGEVLTAPTGQEPVEPTVAEIAVEGGAKREGRVEGSESVQLCARGLSRDGVIAGLRAVLGTDLEHSGEEPGEEADLSFSGTLDETLDHLGLRRCDGSPAS